MFKLEQCDFTLSPSSTFSFERGLLNLDVCGNEEVFESLTQDEDHPFSWSMMPPRFYIRDFPMNPTTDINNFEYKFTDDDMDGYEIDLYMMEYCTVLPCKISGRDGIISVEGYIQDFWGEPTSLSIKLAIT